MHKLHAMTDPNRASGPELLFRTCITSIPAPFAINGKLSAFQDYALETTRGVRAEQQHAWNLSASNRIARASVFSASLNLAFGGE